MPAPDYATEIAGLETSIGRGVLTVEADGERVTYASIADMLKALAYYKGQATASASPSGSTGAFGFSTPSFARD